MKKKSSKNKGYRKLSKEEQLLLKKMALSPDKRIAEEGKRRLVDQYDKLITYVIKKRLIKSHYTIDFELVELLRLSTYIRLFDKSLKAWDPDKDLNGKKTRELGSWIGMIATRTTIDYLRKTDVYEKQPDKKLSINVTVSTDDSEDEISVLDYFGITYSVEMEEKYDAWIKINRLKQLIRRIPSEIQRKILYETLNDKDIDEIATDLNMDKKTAIQTKANAFRRLKKYYHLSLLGIDWSDEDDFVNNIQNLQRLISKMPDQIDQEILRQTLKSKQPDTIASYLNMDMTELIQRQNDALEKFKIFFHDPDNAI